MIKKKNNVEKERIRHKTKTTGASLIIIVQVIFYFLWHHWVLVILNENRISLKPALCVCVSRGWGRGGEGWRMQPCKLQCCIWRDSNKLSLRFLWFCVLFVSRDNPFWLLLWLWLSLGFSLTFEHVLQNWFFSYIPIQMYFRGENLTLL